MFRSISIHRYLFDKKLIAVLFLLTSFFCIHSASAEGVNADGGIDVIEVIDPLRVVFDVKTQTGYIEYAFCYKCKPEKLKITPKTEVFAYGKKVPLAKVKDRLGRYAGLEYEVETMNVISISW